MMQPRLREGRDLLKVTQLHHGAANIHNGAAAANTTTCSVPGTILSALYVLSHLILNNPRRCFAITIVILILQMRKVRQS